MALAYTFSSTGTRTGALNLNRMHRTAAQEDLGGKVQVLISMVNLLVSLVVSAHQSAVGFSALSGVTLTAISNLRS
jgi:hypothetical protein